MLAFVFVIGGFVGMQSLPYHVTGQTTGKAWGAYASQTAAPGAIGVQARAWHSPSWQPVQ